MKTIILNGAEFTNKQTEKCIKFLCTQYGLYVEVEYVCAYWSEKKEPPVLSMTVKLTETKMNCFKVYTGNGPSVFDALYDAVEERRRDNGLD